MTTGMSLVCMMIDGWVWKLEWMWLTDSVGYEA